MAFFIRTFEQQFARSDKSVLFRRPIQLRSQRMKNVPRLPFLLAVVFLASMTGLRAQDELQPPAITPKKTEAVSRDLFDLKSTYVFESELHRSGSFGDQYAIQTSFSYAHRFFLTGNLYLRAGVAYERFDFGGTGAPVPNHLQSVAALIGVDYMHNDDIGAFIQFRPGFYTQSDFDYAAFDVPITLGRVFVLQEDRLYVFAGANAAFLRGRWPVIPILGMIWMPNDQWKVMAMLPEPRIIYSPNDKISFWAGGELAGGSFRTDRNAAIVPARLNGAQVDYAEYRVGGGFIYCPTDNVSINLGGGYVIERQFDFHRADIKYKTDGAPYLRVELKTKF
jgi:hypothetical protein